MVSSIAPHRQPFHRWSVCDGTKTVCHLMRFDVERGHGSISRTGEMCYGLRAGGHRFRTRPDWRSDAETLQTVDMLDQEQTEICLEYAKLKQDHADFDAAINAMIAMGCDPLQIQRMKKKKLALKDRMRILENKIIPDIIA